MFCRLSAATRFVAAGAFSLLLASRGWTQDAPQDHSCTLSGGFLATLPKAGDSQNFVTYGWGFKAGGGFAVTPTPLYGHVPQWFLTGDYFFTKIDATAAALSNANPRVTGATTAHASYSAFTLDITPRVPLYERSRSPLTRPNLYGVLGFGWLRRGIEFNGPNSNSLINPGNPALARTASDSGVFDAAFGVTLAPARMHGLGVFVEGRMYHGLAINNSTLLVPLAAGVRW